MKRIGWILGGMILAAIAFFIPERSGYIWAPVISAVGIAGLFLLGLVVYIIRNGKSQFDRVFGIGIIVLLAGATIYSGVFNYQKAGWQLDLLMDIRATIEKGISQAQSTEPLLLSLEAYHNQDGSNRKAIEAVFLERNGEKIRTINGFNRFIPHDETEEHDSPYLYYAEAVSSDSVVLVAQSMRIPGRDPGFPNYNGANGYMQFKATLTEGGLNYERQN